MSQSHLVLDFPVRGPAIAKALPEELPAVMPDLAKEIGRAFARAVLSGSGDDLREVGRKALGYATTIGRLPQRLDELATRIDRGQLAVRAPGVEKRLSSLERLLGRLISAIVFASLLFSGVLLRRVDEPLSWVLMAASIVPLVHVATTFRRR